MAIRIFVAFLACQVEAAGHRAKQPRNSLNWSCSNVHLLQAHAFRRMEFVSGFATRTFEHIRTSGDQDFGIVIGSVVRFEHPRNQVPRKRKSIKIDCSTGKTVSALNVRAISMGL
jgi:hypothetical protein